MKASSMREGVFNAGFFMCHRSNFSPRVDRDRSEASHHAAEHCVIVPTELSV
jgi:hypothetical protein